MTILIYSRDGQIETKRGVNNIAYPRYHYPQQVEIDDVPYPDAVKIEVIVDGD